MNPSTALRPKVHVPRIQLLYNKNNSYTIDVAYDVLQDVVNTSPLDQWRYSDYSDAQEYFWYTRLEVLKPLYITLLLKYG